MAEEDGEARLYLSEDNFGDHQVYAVGAARASLPIRCLRGERYFRAAASAVDLIKVDTQGSEHAVMQGLDAYRAQHGPLPADMPRVNEAETLSNLINLAIDNDSAILVEDGGTDVGVITRVELLRTVIEGTEVS